MPDPSITTMSDSFHPHLALYHRPWISGRRRSPWTEHTVRAWMAHHGLAPDSVTHRLQAVHRTERRQLIVSGKRRSMRWVAGRTTWWGVRVGWCGSAMLASTGQKNEWWWINGCRWRNDWKKVKDVSSGKKSQFTEWTLTAVSMSVSHLCC